ncbi:hypothetical protein FRC10_006060, partial [Ceratobasidium sp. 414]
MSISPKSLKGCHLAIPPTRLPTQLRNKNLLMAKHLRLSALNTILGKAEYTRDGSHVRITDQHSGEKHMWDMIERPAKANKCKLDRKMKLECDPANKDRHDLYLDIQNKIRLDMHVIMGRNAMTHKWGQVPLDVHAKIALVVRDAFPYLFRFKDNWAAYEIMRHVLSNKRDHTRRGRTGN